MAALVLAAGCGDCGGRVVATEGPYRNLAGKRICLRCELLRRPDVAAVLAETVATFRRAS